MRLTSITSCFLSHHPAECKGGGKRWMFSGRQRIFPRKKMDGSRKGEQKIGNILLNFHSLFDLVELKVEQIHDLQIRILLLQRINA